MSVPSTRTKAFSANSSNISFVTMLSETSEGEKFSQKSSLSNSIIRSAIGTSFDTFFAIINTSIKLFVLQALWHYACIKVLLG